MHMIGIREVEDTCMFLKVHCALCNEKQRNANYCFLLNNFSSTGSHSVYEVWTMKVI